MSTTAIIAEFIVIGLLVFATILFLVLSVLQVNNFNFLIQLKEFSGAIAVLITVIFYFLGALHNHLTHLIYSFLTKPVQFASEIKFLKLLLRNKPRSRDCNTLPIFLFILENGSSSLIERIKYMHSLSRLFSSISTITPVFGVSLVIWFISLSSNWKAAFVSIVVCSLLSLLTTIAASTVSADYIKELRIADEIIRARMSSSRS